MRLVADGGAVVEGEPLYSLESDKSTNEVDAPASGTLRILKEVGETYEVGTILGVNRIRRRLRPPAANDPNSRRSMFDMGSGTGVRVR